MIVQGREIKTLSPTSLAAWLRCRGDWYNRYVLKSDRGGTWNMMAGNIIHLGAQLHHQGLDWKAGMIEFYEAHREIMSAEDAPSLEKLLTLMRVYIMKNPRQEDDQPEEYFKIAIPGLEQPATGIFDLLRGDGIIEFKTGGFWTQARVDLAMQTVHYSMAYRAKYGHMPKYFRYYWFDFENTRVKEIETSVTEEEVDQFIEWMKKIVSEMETGVIIPRCRFTDNKQECWYPEQCLEIEQYNHSRAILIEQRKSSGEGTKGRREEESVPQPSEDNK